MEGGGGGIIRTGPLKTRRRRGFGSRAAHAARVPVRAPEKI